MTFSFVNKPSQVAGQSILTIPQSISQQFPSRGQVMLQGQLNGQTITAPVEPDGRGGHFVVLPDEPTTEAVELSFDLLTDWPVPDRPSDVLQEIQAADLEPVWQSLTTRAQWDWLRWIRATKQPATRAKRIGVMISKLSNGDRRPCCFNRASCTIVELAKGGVLNDERG